MLAKIAPMQSLGMSFSRQFRRGRANFLNFSPIERPILPNSGQIGGCASNCAAKGRVAQKNAAWQIAARM
jgi:hypothetical protein